MILSLRKMVGWISAPRVIHHLICLIPLFLMSSLSYSAHLNNIQFYQENNKARMEIVLDHASKYHIFTLAHPNRLVIDLSNTSLATNLKKIDLNHSVLANIRSGHPKASTLRLVCDLKKSIHYKTLAEFNKIIIEIDAPNVPQVSITKKYKPIIIVIDPGHGGKDSGAIGEYGTEEKHVVLGIARRLARLINQVPYQRAVLTRNGDYFVPLRGRLRLAHKGKADLFIAIHADSYFNRRSSGASVYALSHRGATSEAARYLAKRENYSELGGVDLSGLEDKSYMLRSVLIDLAQTATITDSLRLGNAMLNSLGSVTKLHYRRVEQAPFVVLKSPDIPSILVETGFISNPAEERMLTDADYQNNIAEALFNGIQYYLTKYSV